MKRQLLLFSLALIIGILSASITRSYKFIITTLLVLIALSLFLIAIYIYGIPFRTSPSQKTRKPDSLPLTLVFLLVGILAFYTIGAVRYLYLDRDLICKYKQFDQQLVLIKGKVNTKPEYKEGRICCEVIVQQIIEENEKPNVENERLSKDGQSEEKETTNKNNIPGKVFLSINEKELSKGKIELLEYGREIEVSGSLVLPFGKRNPGGFDYRRYLASRGISATIYAKGTNITIGSFKGRNLLIGLGISIRQRIVEIIKKSLPKEQADLMNAMLIGYREGFPKELKETFSDSGLIHIMAVSGLHVGFIILLFIFIFKKLGLKRKIANPIVIFILLIYVLITGYQPSVIRAVIMVSAALLGQMLCREPDTLTGVSLALIIILLWTPHMVFNVGLQLSFAATLSIILFSKNIKEMFKKIPIYPRIPKSVINLLSTTLSAQLGVLPITIIHFNKISVVSLLSNLLAAPLAGVIIILGMIMVLSGQINIYLSRTVGYINCPLLTFIIFVSKTTVQLPFAVIRWITPSAFLVFVYYAAIYFIFYIKPEKKLKIKIKTKHYIIGTIFLFMFVILINVIPFSRKMEVVFLDVGEGDAAFIRTSQGKTVLIDGGGEKGKPEDEPNTGEKIIIPFLLNYGVLKLDLIVATHAHEDHILGLLEVLKKVKVKNVVLPDYNAGDEFDRLLSICDEKRIKVSYLSEGDQVKLDKETYFEVLNPPNKREISELSLNNSSVVLKLCYKDTGILFTGDIEKEGEGWIIGKYFNNGKPHIMNIESDVLKVAHHGSSTSSTERFLDIVKPKAAVISVGKNNYKHPSKEVIDRLIEKESEIYRTDLRGAIILESNGKKIRVKVMVEDEY